MSDPWWCFVVTVGREPEDLFGGQWWGNVYAEWICADRVVHLGTLQASPRDVSLEVADALVRRIEATLSKEDETQ